MTNNVKVYVTGLGVISSLGDNVEQNLESLIQKKSGLSKIEYLDTIHKDFFVGEIKYSNSELAIKLGLDADVKMPRTTLLAMIAAKEAYENAGLTAEDALSTGVITGTTVGGMDRTENHYKTPEKDPSFITSHSCGYTTEQVVEYLQVSGLSTTLSTACSSAANSILIGSRFIKHGLVDRVIAGGQDGLAKFTLNGFKSLMILDSGECTPFDLHRKGLNLGEGAGFIVIESEESMKRRGVKPLALVAGYANSNDAHHQTASSPDGVGPYLCMKRALEVANLKPEQIDYINVHGTGTGNNDETEALAMERVFGENLPAYSSTKSYTGHTLGASGGLEAIYSILSMQHRVLFPNLRFKDRMDGFNHEPVKDVIRDVELNHVMSNSFGFGGNDSSLIFSKV